VIKVKQVKVKHGEGYITIEYDVNDDSGNVSVESLDVSISDVNDRLRELKRLTGVDPTESDVKNVLRALVNEVRAGVKPLLPYYDYSLLIEVNLEA
jgi:hypothetical protein